MAIYTLYLTPEEDIEDSADTFRLIPDGKAKWALFFPPLWLAWHRLWLALLVYLLVMFAIIILAFWQPSPAVGYLSVLPGLYLMLEGYQLVRAGLERKGWRYAGLVEGENREEAEIRVLINMNDNVSSKKRPDINHGRPALAGSVANQDNMGLFPE